MPSRSPNGVLYLLIFYAFGLFNWFLYLGISMYTRSFFKQNTEQDVLKLAIARDQLWNLSKQPIAGFNHCFYTLRSGVKLHYITNYGGLQRHAKANLAVFVHGFPDSSMEWRYLLQSQQGTRLQVAILVCVDLPGYGGSGSLDAYGPDQVLEALAEFIVAMQETYLLEDAQDLMMEERKTYIIAHDWGCLLGFRLAAEAAGLADRFILMNGPHPELARANGTRITNSASKIFRQFRQDPWKNRACFSKAWHSLTPLLGQVLRFGYIFAFHLPAIMVRYLGTGGNFAFMRGAQQSAYGKDKSEYHVQEALAATLGPSPIEFASQNDSSETYSESVLPRAQNFGTAFMHQTSYYRDGAAFGPWTKSLELIADLHAIELSNADGSPFRRRSSSTSSALFAEAYKGALHAPTTILWGQKDQACSQAICLDGIGDYLPRESEVVLLPRTGHWTPIEKASRDLLTRVIEFYVLEGNVAGSIGAIVKESYEGATMTPRK